MWRPAPDFGAVGRRVVPSFPARTRDENGYPGACRHPDRNVGVCRLRRRHRRADLQAEGRPQRHRLRLRKVRLRVQAEVGGRPELYRRDQEPWPRPLRHQGHDSGLGCSRADGRRRFAGSAEGTLCRRLGGGRPRRRCGGERTGRRRKTLGHACSRSARRGSSEPAFRSGSRSSSSPKPRIAWRARYRPSIGRRAATGDRT